MKKQLCPKYSY